MRKFYSTLAVLLMLAGCLSAQNYTSKDFNNIKRSKEYFYYDITMEDEKKAKENANVNLAKLINDYCVENSITNVKVSENELKSVQYLRMDKNGFVRILAYVKREDYIGKEKAPAVEQAKSKEPVVAVVKIEPKPQAKEMPKVVKETVVSLPPTKAPSAETAALAKNEAAASLVKWQQEVLQGLCGITSAEKLLMRLAELQNQYKVKRFGLNDDCRNVAQSFWVVYDSNKNVTAILGPGSTERYNFLKGVNDTLESYTSRGMNVIWFQLSK